MSANKKIRLTAELPRRSPHCQRFRAEQIILGREVEFRLLPEGVSPESQAAFQAELDDLLVLDHPGFLPILDRGSTRGRPFYMVPLRDHPQLSDLIPDEEFSLEERCEAVRGLAGAFACLHLIETSAGRPAPANLCWDRTKSLLYFVHHRGVLPPANEGPTLPPDASPGAEPSPRGDLYHWGWLSYLLLSGGEPPLGEGGPDESPTPIRVHAPNVAPALAHAVEACLSWEPVKRPGNAAELHAVLQLSNRNVIPDDELSVDLSETIPTSRIEESIMDLKLSGKIPEPKPRPAPPPAPVPAEPMSGPVWAATVVTVLLLGFGVGVTLPRLLRPAPAATAAPAPPPPAPPPTGSGVPPTPAPPPPARSPDLVELAPSTQARYRADPRIQKLTSTREIERDDFTPLWKILRDLSLGKGLPDQLNDQSRILDLRRTFSRDPDKACADLKAYLADLRMVLGIR